MDLDRPTELIWKGSLGIREWCFSCQRPPAWLHCLGSLRLQPEAEKASEGQHVAGCQHDRITELSQDQSLSPAGKLVISTSERSNLDSSNTLWQRPCRQPVGRLTGHELSGRNELDQEARLAISAWSETDERETSITCLGNDDLGQILARSRRIGV